MYRFTDSRNQNVKEQNFTPEAVSRTREVKLDILVLEERIAPMRFDGLDGESQDKDHKGWSDLIR